MGIHEPTRAMRLYSGYGCTISADLDLSFPDPAGGLAAPPDVIVQRANSEYDPDWVPASESVISRDRDVARGHSYVSCRVGDGYRIRFDGLCEFDLNADLDQIRWRLAPAADAELIPLVTAGAVMTFRFMLAGDLVLHCSAVNVDGKGLAFVGGSGMGKSTMAALMCAAGATFITDDVGRVTWESGVPALAVGGSESRLRGSARHLAELAPRSDVRSTRDERLAVSYLQPLDSAPLEAIVVPLPVRNRSAVELRTLPSREAVVALNSFPRLAGLTDVGMAGRQFGQIADLVKRVPVFAAAIPWEPAPGPQIGAALVEALGWKLPVTGDSPVNQQTPGLAGFACSCRTDNAQG